MDGIMVDVVFANVFARRTDVDHVVLIKGKAETAPRTSPPPFSLSVQDFPLCPPTDDITTLG
jgi:hypothetical protein